MELFFSEIMLGSFMCGLYTSAAYTRVFRVFSFDFSEEIISVLKPLKTSSVLELGSSSVENCYSLKQHFIINFGFTLKMFS